MRTYFHFFSNSRVYARFPTRQKFQILKFHLYRKSIDIGMHTAKTTGYTLTEFSNFQKYECTANLLFETFGMEKQGQ